MDIKNIYTIIAIYLVSLFCGSNSSVLSGLAGFGFSPLEYDACEDKISDTRTCYVTEVTNISCFNVEIKFDACKKHLEAFNSNTSDFNKAHSNWTHLQAYYHRHNGERHRPGKIGSCLELKPGVCTQSRCLKTCCPGWFQDENGECTKSSFGRCYNGGTYNFRGRNCYCLPRFSGQHCEIALCPGGCLNGGQCSPTAEGENVCICPAGVYGTNCQNIRCRYKCENGGQCILDGPIPTCKCPYGFYGKTCAHSYTDDSVCPPPNNTVCIDLNCQDECDAGSCNSGHVCCTDGCCTKCVKPRSPGCLHNDILYQPLDIFRKDRCTMCACLHNGNSQCYIFPENGFTDLSCYGIESTSPIPPVHRLPKLNCSGDVIKVPVYRFSHYAYMRTLNIQAEDERGKSLKVQYIPSYIILGKVPLSRRNVEIIKVIAKDSLGQTNECHQRVLVVDDTHPMFVSCPTDSVVNIQYHSTQMFNQPKARDNVGIQSLVCFPSDKTFSPGLHIISCTAVDYDGNQAFCQTRINVTGPGSTDNVAPIFLSCPSDIYASEGELVSWREPTAYDHYGIRSLVSNFEPHRTFPVGWTTVMYTATDYNNNYESCTFSVIVTQKNTYSEVSAESHMTNSVRITVACVSCLVVIIVIILVTVILYRRFRRKSTNRLALRQSNNRRNGVNQIPTISNALYDCTPLGLDGQPIVPTLKPPPYSPAIDPPSYEEVYANPCLLNDASEENPREHPPAYEVVT